MPEFRNIQLRPPPRGLPSRRSRLHGAYRLLLVIAVLLVAVGLIFPLVFEPAVEPPESPALGNPFSIRLLVENQNMTPITDVDYTCEVSKFTRSDGAAVTGPSPFIRSTIRRLPGREAIREPCEAAPASRGPIQAAEFKVTISYRMYPWPSRRTSVYSVVAQVDPSGRVTGWKVR